MRRPFSLAAYRALSARKPPPDLAGDPPPVHRPVAWFHATSDTRAAALLDLADRMRQNRPDIHILMTFDQRLLTGPRPARSDVAVTELPIDSDHPAWASSFIEQWRPAVGLWTGGPLRPNLIAAAHGGQVPLILCDVDETDLGRESLTWLPDPTRAVLRLFDRAFTLDVATFTRLKRIGLPISALQVAPRLQDSLAPPPCAEADLTDAGEILAGRPVWYAAGLGASETAMLLTAHRHAVRLAHRLLLVITPGEGANPEALEALLAGSGLRHANWDPVDPIDEFTQVLVARDPDSPALWFRLAPVSVMGGTLGPGETPGFHPFIPAALGSAVLYGPHTGLHASAYTRLNAAGGAQMVRGADHLADMALRLSQPDIAARMALEGWDVVTEGAWLIDHLLEVVQDKYDESEARHETA